MKPLPLWKPGLAWLLVLGPLFFVSYGFANHQAAGAAAVPSIVFDWERHIPLWPWTILPYWSIDFFYGLSLLVCTTRLELHRHGLRLLTAQVLSITWQGRAALAKAYPHHCFNFGAAPRQQENPFADWRPSKDAYELQRDGSRTTLDS